MNKHSLHAYIALVARLAPHPKALTPKVLTPKALTPKAPTPAAAALPHGI